MTFALASNDTSLPLVTFPNSSPAALPGPAFSGRTERREHLGDVPAGPWRLRKTRSKCAPGRPSRDESSPDVKGCFMAGEVHWRHQLDN